MAPDPRPVGSRKRADARRLVVLGAPRGGGAVWLVGAGPGDPELLTVKAVRALERADVVIHDGLVSRAIVDLAPAGARRICVAKRKAHHSYAQGDIDRLLVALALQGLTVVRLKGGDPFMFGRGGEELEACRAAGVACHVVPGVTAALAAAAAVGAPLTHRGAAQAVTFVTGHAALDAKGLAEPDLDWTSLARPNQTVVIYMGLSNAAAIAHRLIGAGRAPSTPALIVENISLEGERRVITTLGELGAAASGLSGPALLMVGEAMALASDRSEIPEGRLEKGVAMKALTANRLADGEVVFWNAGAWLERFDDAQMFDEDAQALDAEALAAGQITLLVDPYLIDVEPAEGGLVPVSYRERLRALGPTNKLDHGKQAAGGAAMERLAHARGAARSSGRVNLIKRK